MPESIFYSQPTTTPQNELQVEMRKLASEDKGKANKIANECGSNIITDLQILVQCELKLIYGTEDFFNDNDKKAPFSLKTRNIDGEIPILYITSRGSKSR